MKIIEISLSFVKCKMRSHETYACKPIHVNTTKCHTHVKVASFLFKSLDVVFVARHYLFESCDFSILSFFGFSRQGFSV